jgi:uncharacterized protein (DUF2235 family)
MAKRIIFCADGTWNGPPAQTGVSALDDSDTHGEVKGDACTNVFKLFANLAGQDTLDTIRLSHEQERVLRDAAGNTVQVAKYIHGVGDSRNPLLRMLGGVFGMGVISRVVRGYTFISRSYEPGDEIHIIGFSRGAYTARALAGMIANVGLLDPSAYDPADKDEAYRLGIAAFARSKNTSLGGTKRWTSLANTFIGFVQNIIASRLPDNALRPNVPIKSVAVWDTVGSMGIPKYAGDERVDILRFTDNKLSAKVERGFHAMAIDELRRDFPVLPWEPRGGVEQVWFVGAHSDVGGGYDTAGSYLSDVALAWMMSKLAKLGVVFSAPLMHEPDPQPLGGPWHTPWLDPPFEHFPEVARRVDATDTLHASVLQRWNAAGADPYRPLAMRAFAQHGLNAFRVDDAI